MTKHYGFTLIELSLVLVIIGLLAAGVMVGQDLLRQSEIRTVLKQYEEFNGALGTFHTTYGGLPGDIKGATSWGFTGDGNQDGVLDHQGSTAHDYELVYFWNHLGSKGAGLIKGAYSGQTLSSSNISSQLPKATIGNYWGVFSSRGTTFTNEINYYVLTATIPSSGSVYTTEYMLNPTEAWSMDNKIDDGIPIGGAIQAINKTTPWDATLTQSSTNCVSSNIYQTTLRTKICILRLAMPF